MPIERLEQANERMARVEEWSKGHEALCAGRYADIIAKIDEIKSVMTSNGRLYLTIAFALFSLELGKATFPVLFAALAKTLSGP